MKKSPYYIQSSEKRKDIDRYSDKYQIGQDALGQWKPGKLSFTFNSSDFLKSHALYYNVNRVIENISLFHLLFGIFCRISIFKYINCL